MLAILLAFVLRELEPVPSVATAQKLYVEAQFTQSILMLDKLVRMDLSPEERIQARLYLALNFLAVGNEKRAEHAMQELIDLDPEFVPPTAVSRSVRAFFDKVKASYRIIPIMEHDPPPRLDGTRGADFRVKLKRMQKGYQARMFFRASGTPYYSKVDLSKQGADQYLASIPPALLMRSDGYTFEYFIVVTERDKPVAQLRDPQSPFSVPVDVPLDARPVYKKWWFWTVLGGAAAVVAGGVVTAALLTRPGQPAPFGDAAVSLRF